MATAFDRRTARRRFAVLGDTRRSDTGRPAEAASRALRTREATLVPELRRRGRTGTLADRRIARGDGLARFAAEAKRRARLNAAPSISGDDSLALTHRGRALTEDDMDSDPEDMDDSDEDEHASRLADGRTHAQVMADVVANAKAHRAERQRASAETRAMTADIDAAFDDIMGALPVRSRAESKKAEPTDFDADVAALAFDKRAAPADRTPTPEDAAKLRAERTRQYEKEVLEGMAGDRPDDLADDGLPNADVSPDAAQSHAAVRAQAERLLSALCDASSADDAQVAYAQLARLAATASVVHVAHAVRARLAAALAAFARRRHMPARPVLLLLYFAQRVFRVSDRHHVVATPASLAIAGFLQRGRLLSLAHVRSALFLVRLALDYARPAGRVVPEALSALHAIVVLTTGTAPIASSQYPSGRPIARVVHESFRALGDVSAPADLPLTCLFGDDSDASQLASFALHLTSIAAEQYADSQAAPELLNPLLHLLGRPALSGPRPAPAMLAARAPQIASLEPEVVSARAARAADRGAHLRRERAREMRGARRELRRDAAFLAVRQRADTLEADRKYAERQRKILGTIAADAAGK